MVKRNLAIALLLSCLMTTCMATDHKPPKSIMIESDELLNKLSNCPYNIIYETYVNNNWELFVMNADGSEVKNLTHTPTVHEMYPHVSPDGTKVCFVSDEERDSGKIRCVYYMNIDGSERTTVAEGARQPCWSPDGKTIAYLKSKYPKFQINDYATQGVWFYDLDTQERREHPNKDIHHLYNICWSKNGKWIVATVHAGMGYSHTNLAVEVGGMNVYNLEIGGCRPDLCPDGKRIAWGKTDNIISVADIDLESSVPKVTNIRDVIVENIHVYHVDWSPDGKYLSYSRGPGGQTPEGGPGTNRGIAELVGVKGIWDVCITPVEGDRLFTDLTKRKETCKESDWFVPSK